MKLLLSNARYIACGLIILAFIIPAYHGISAFGFISFAFAETKGKNEITSTDVWITIIPLILIPLSATGIAIRAYLKLSTRKTFIYLPLLCFAFFTAILFMSLRSDGIIFSGRNVLSDMSFGFYLLAVGCLILPFTKTRRKRKIKNAVRTEMEIAV